MNIQQALQELEAGELLVTGNTLLRMRNGRILITSGGWTARMDPQKFLELYQNREFGHRPPTPSVDEEADLQYYGKLRNRQ